LVSDKRREITFFTYSKLQIISPTVVEYIVNTDNDDDNIINNNNNNKNNNNYSTAEMGHVVAFLVEALYYKPEGCGFDSR
jgi:hypothetical protein